MPFMSDPYYAFGPLRDDIEKRRAAFKAKLSRTSDPMLAIPINKHAAALLLQADRYSSDRTRQRATGSFQRTSPASGFRNPMLDWMADCNVHGWWIMHDRFHNADPSWPPTRTLTVVFAAVRFKDVADAVAFTLAWPDALKGALE